MFSSLPMVTISRDLRKPTELIAANTFPVPKFILRALRFNPCKSLSSAVY
jgi:hypothetical protein